MKQHIHESNLIEGYDDPEFDKQSMVAWKFLSKQKTLTEAVVREVQKLIVESQADFDPQFRGAYRTVQVWVGGHEGLFYWVIKDHMTAWLHRVNEWSIDPKGEHISFEKIHPFVDGNGRTGRMLMWWHEIKLGDRPTLILNSQKQDYYKWFKEAK